MHQPLWSYASTITQPSWLWSFEHERATQDGYITHRSIHDEIIMHQPSWSFASSITQPSWRWSYKHGKSYARSLHHTPIKTRKDYHVSMFMIIRIKDNPTILALELWTWKELQKMVTSHTGQYTKKLSCINHHDHTHQAKPNHSGVGVINMERATQDGYITHRSIHEKIIMHQPLWSFASSITQTSWLWSYEHGKSYTRWLHHTPINKRKDYHASTFMIIRIKHNPTILSLKLSTRKELRKMVTSQTDQNTKSLSCINLHDHTHQARPNHFDVGVINTERATQDGYITHRSINEKNIMHQPSWSYASRITQQSWLWSFEHERATQDGYITHRSIHDEIIMHQPSWSFASSITQASWRWSY